MVVWYQGMLILIHIEHRKRYFIGGISFLVEQIENTYYERLNGGDYETYYRIAERKQWEIFENTLQIN